MGNHKKREDQTSCKNPKHQIISGVDHRRCVYACNEIKNILRQQNTTSLWRFYIIEDPINK